MLPVKAFISRIVVQSQKRKTGLPPLRLHLFGRSCLYWEEDVDAMDQTVMPLTALKSGQTAAVRTMDLPQAAEKRLRDLGLIPGARICLDLICPLGDPGIYTFQDTCAAIRSGDAAGILVELV